jgi:hypothetical protein
MAAWDFAWTHIGPVAGIGAEPTPAQAQLREALAQLYDTPMPARAIEQMAMAIYSAWKSELRRASGDNASR